MALLKNNNGASQFFVLIGLIILGLGLLAVTTFVLSGVYGFSIAELPILMKAQNPTILPYMKATMLIQAVLMFILPSVIFALVMHKNPFKFLGLQMPAVKWHWIAGVALLLLAFPFVGLIGKLNELIVPEYFKAASADYNSQMDMIIADMRANHNMTFMLFTAGFLAGLGEELLFRGCLQNLLIKFTKNPWIGILITAFIFSAIHFEFTGFIPRFALGVLLGAAYWYTSSLWVSIMGHAAFNMVSVLGTYFKIDTEATKVLTTNEYIALIVMGLISLGIVISVLYALIITSHTKFNAVYEISDKPKSDFENYFNS
jgi:uncharacterized protein